MFEQLTQLVNQFGSDAVVNNPAVPNEHNTAVLQHANSSIVDSLRGMISGGNISDLTSLFQENNAANGSNPAVQKIINNLTNSLGEKFGLSTDTASDIAGSLIPKVLGTLIGSAKDPNNPSFNVSDIIGCLTGGNNASNGGIMNTISKYGEQFGLDKDGDGQVGISDAVATLTKKSSGLSGLLGKLFGVK